MTPGRAQEIINAFIDGLSNKTKPKEFLAQFEQIKALYSQFPFPALGPLKRLEQNFEQNLGNGPKFLELIPGGLTQRQYFEVAAYVENQALEADKRELEMTKWTARSRAEINKQAEMKQSNMEVDSEENEDSEDSDDDEVVILDRPQGSSGNSQTPRGFQSAPRNFNRASSSSASSPSAAPSQATAPVPNRHVSPIPSLAHYFPNFQPQASSQRQSLQQPQPSQRQLSAGSGSQPAFMQNGPGSAFAGYGNSNSQQNSLFPSRELQFFLAAESSSSDNNFGGMSSASQSAVRPNHPAAMSDVASSSSSNSPSVGKHPRQQPPLLPNPSDDESSPSVAKRPRIAASSSSSAAASASSQPQSSLPPRQVASSHIQPHILLSSVAVGSALTPSPGSLASVQHVQRVAPEAARSLFFPARQTNASSFKASTATRAASAAGPSMSAGPSFHSMALQLSASSSSSNSRSQAAVSSSDVDMDDLPKLEPLEEVLRAYTPTLSPTMDSSSSSAAAVSASLALQTPKKSAAPSFSSPASRPARHPKRSSLRLGLAQSLRGVPSPLFSNSNNSNSSSSSSSSSAGNELKDVPVKQESKLGNELSIKELTAKVNAIRGKSRAKYRCAREVKKLLDCICNGDVAEPPANTSPCTFDDSIVKYMQNETEEDAPDGSTLTSFEPYEVFYVSGELYRNIPPLKCYEDKDGCLYPDSEFINLIEQEDRFPRAHYTQLAKTIEAQAARENKILAGSVLSFYSKYKEQTEPKTFGSRYGIHIMMFYAVPNKKVVIVNFPEKEGQRVFHDLDNYPGLLFKGQSLVGKETGIFQMEPDVFYVVHHSANYQPRNTDNNVQRPSLGLRS